MRYETMQVNSFLQRQEDYRIPGNNMRAPVPLFPDSVYTFRVLTVLMSGYSERIVIRSWYSVLPRMDSVYTFV